MAIMNSLGLFTVRWWNVPYGTPLFAVTVIVTAVIFAVLYFFWKGQNWARWLVLAASALAIFNLKEITHPTMAEWDTAIRIPLLYAQALFASFLLYYLNTSGARSWFYRDRLRKMQLQEASDQA